MQIYELKINDKKNETKIFWCRSVEELERVTREQIKQGARNICWEEDNIPTEILAKALSVLSTRDKKYKIHPLRKPTSTFKSHFGQSRCIETKSEGQK